MNAILKQQPVRLRSFEVSVVGWSESAKVMHGTSAGSARYRRFLDLREVDPDLKITAMRSRVVHEEPVEPPGFRRCMEKRGIPFAKVEMRVRVDGQEGRIVGHNDSANLDVLFASGIVGNCHPHWRVEYLDESGAVIKAYGDGNVVKKGAA